MIDWSSEEMALRKSMIKCEIRTPEGLRAAGVLDRDEIALAWGRTHYDEESVEVVLKSGLQLTVNRMNLDKLWRGYIS